MHEKVDPVVELPGLRPNRWKQLAWIVAMGVMFYGVSAVASVLSRWMGLASLPSVSLGQLGIMLVAIGFALADGGGLRNLGLTAPWKAIDAAAIAAMFMIHFVGSGVSAVVLQAVGLLEPDNMRIMNVFSEFGKLSPGAFLGMSLLLALQAGLGEELLFRGYLITRLERLGLGAWPSIVISALAFGLIHAPSGYGILPSLSKAIWFGIPTGAYFWYRRNLGPVVLVHFFVDFLSFMAIFVLSKIAPGQIPGM